MCNRFTAQITACGFRLFNKGVSTWAITLPSSDLCIGDRPVASYLLAFGVDRETGNAVYVRTITDGSAAFLTMVTVSASQPREQRARFPRLAASTCVATAGCCHCCV